MTENTSATEVASYLAQVEFKPCGPLVGETRRPLVSLSATVGCIIEEVDMAPNIEQEILIDAPVDVVWRAVTEPEQVSQWFSDEVDLEAKAGYEGVLTFNDRATKQSMSVHVAVQSVEPARTFSYRWLHPQGAAASEGNSLLVEFTLTPEGDGMRLRVVETGLEQMGWPAEQQDTYVREHNEGWVTHLARLRDHLSRRRVDHAQ